MFTPSNRGSVGIIATIFVLAALIVAVVSYQVGVNKGYENTAHGPNGEIIGDNAVGGNSDTNSSLRILPPGTLRVGSSTTATSISFMKKATCDLTGPSIGATTTAYTSCAVSGVLSGDYVFVSLATSSPAAAVVGARASTTAGIITIKLLNLSGAAADTTAFGTGTTVWIVR